MEMKKIFESSFADCAVPEAYYIYGDFLRVFVIAKYPEDRPTAFFLYALDVEKKFHITLQCDYDFCKLVDIINMLTGHYGYKSYYERPIEE